MHGCSDSSQRSQVWDGRRRPMQRTLVARRHTAPWMLKKKEGKKTKSPLQEEPVLLLTGAMHGHACNSLTRVDVGAALQGKKLRDIACGKNHAVLLTNDGSVATFGDNRRGQCGRPLDIHVYDPSFSLTFKVFEGLGVDSCAAGGRCTFLYAKGTRRCFVAGDNEFHQLGLGADYQLDISTSEAVEEGTFGIPWHGVGAIPEEEGGIAKISTGSAHTLLLTEAGNVFAFGSAHDGQLGTGSTVAHNIPYALKFFRAQKMKATDVFAGNACSFVVTQDHGVFAMGKCDEGRIGLPFSLQKPVTLLPKPVSLPIGVPAHVCGGLAHGAAVNSRGDWVVFGGSQRLGVTPPMCKDHADIYQYRPAGAPPPNVRHATAHSMRLLEAETPRPVCSFTSGDYHTVGLSSQGEVWGTGWNGDAQLGITDSDDTVAQRVLMHVNPDLVAAAAGGNFTLLGINATPSTPHTWEGVPSIRVRA